jgi:hypothetical protein
MGGACDFERSGGDVFRFFDIGFAHLADSLHSCMSPKNWLSLEV